MKEINRILEMGEEKFFSEGFHKTKMDDIAAELKISKKTIYKFFTSKQELAHAVAKLFMEKMKNMIVPALSSNKNAIEKLNDLISILAKTSDRINPKTFDEIRLHFPEIWNEVDEFRTKMMFGNITKVIDQGKTERLFIDYPTPIVMNMLVASVRSVVNPEFILHNNFSLIEAASTAFQIMIGGIITEKGKKLLTKNKRMTNENN